MKFILPKPPSVNTYWRHSFRGGFARVYISKEGQDWLEEAGYKLKAQWDKKLHTSNLTIDIKLYYCGRADVDNFNKALFDLFTKIGVIKDDDQFQSMNIEKFRVSHRNEEKVEVKITPYSF